MTYRELIGETGVLISSAADVSAGENQRGSRMPRKQVTIQLDGRTIPIEEFAEAMGGWVEQLLALRDEVAPQAQIKWVISELKEGSAICTIRGEAMEGTSEDEIDEILSEYENEWEAFKSGRPSSHSYAVQSSTRKIASVLNGQVTAIKTRTDGQEITVSTDESKSAFKISKGVTSFGSVRGKIQTISTRSSNHFHLYDSDDDHKITCYLREGSEEKMKEVWGREAIVEGDLYRDAKTGVVLTVRDVTTVEQVVGHNNWRAAVGISPTQAGGIAPEEAVRRMRNG